MADFKRAFTKLMKLEFNSPSNYLHKNQGENDYTIGGIYKSAHPLWIGWLIVSVAIEKNNTLAQASQELYHSTTIQELVAQFYKVQFWDKIKGDSIRSQNTAEEIFLFGVNSGMKNAVRKAQKIIGCETDGMVGPMTLEALNEFHEGQFDMQFDELEKQFYADLILKKPSFKIFENGWNNRAEYV